jgi:biotin/methionine sulfoxide reductase
VGNSGLDLSGNPNVLTLDIGSSGFGQGCAAHTCLVQVEPHADAPDPVATYTLQLAALLPA